MKCQDCFYGEQAPLDANNIGQVRPVICRRFPPSAQLLPTNQGVQMVANFPMMAPDAWCWEFKTGDGKFFYEEKTHAL